MPEAGPGVPGAARTPRNFRALWAASAATNLADGVFKLSLPLVAVSLTDSPALVAGASFANSLPWLLFALLAGGALADRVDRRGLMAWVNAGRAALLGLLAAAAATGNLSLPALYAGALALGTCEALADTTAMSVVQMVVPKDRLKAASARLTATETVANEFAGPPLGGALAALGLAVALGASGGAYAAAAVALWAMAGSYRSAHRGRGPEASASELARGMKADIAEGLRYVWGQKTLGALLAAAAAAVFCFSAWTAVIVLYAVEPGPLGLGRAGYGLLVGALGVGGLAGSLLAPPLGRLLGRRAVLGGALAGGAGSGAWTVAYSSLRALVVPDEMMGRYSGVSRLMSRGALPLGALAAGVVAELAGVRAVFAAGAVVCALTLLLTLRAVSPANLREIEEEAVGA